MESPGPKEGQVEWKSPSRQVDDKSGVIVVVGQERTKMTIREDEEVRMPDMKERKIVENVEKYKNVKITKTSGKNCCKKEKKEYNWRSWQNPRKPAENTNPCDENEKNDRKHREKNAKRKREIEHIMISKKGKGRGLENKLRQDEPIGRDYEHFHKLKKK